MDAVIGGAQAGVGGDVVSVQPVSVKWYSVPTPNSSNSNGLNNVIALEAGSHGLPQILGHSAKIETMDSLGRFGAAPNAMAPGGGSW